MNSQLLAATNNRDRAQLIASEVLFYGTLLTVLGAAGIEAELGSDAIHARNLGAGLGFSSTVFSNRYKVQDQAPVFRKASQRLACTQPALELMARFESEIITIVNSDGPLPIVGGKDFRTAFADVPRQVVFFVEQQTVPDLQAALSSIQLGQLSVEEVKAVIDRWEAARRVGRTGAAQTLRSQEGSNLLANQSPADSAALNRALTEQLSFTESLKLCRTQHPI